MLYDSRQVKARKKVYGGQTRAGPGFKNRGLRRDDNLSLTSLTILTWGPPWGGGTNWGDMRDLASGLLRCDKPPKLASTLRGGGHFPKCTFFGHFDRGLCPEFFFEKATSIFDWRLALRNTLEK